MAIYGFELIGGSFSFGSKPVLLSATGTLVAVHGRRWLMGWLPDYFQWAMSSYQARVEMHRTQGRSDHPS